MIAIKQEDPYRCPLLHPIAVWTGVGRLPHNVLLPKLFHLKKIYLSVLHTKDFQITEERVYCLNIDTTAIL